MALVREDLADAEHSHLCQRMPQKEECRDPLWNGQQPNWRADAKATPRNCVQISPPRTRISTGWLFEATLRLLTFDDKKRA
jgi:hypothetical protein